MRRPRKTYSHLDGRGKMPSEYEIVSSRLHYYLDRGFEVRTKVGEWFETYQHGSRIRGTQWEEFRDPRATTYADYVALQHHREVEIDGFLRVMAKESHERGLGAEWATVLEAFAVLRHPFHALQMVAAYVGHLAPSATLTIACAMQAADERRRVERIAYRIALRRRFVPSFAEGSREAWERDPAFQPLRSLIEHLLVAYDWGEAFVATNLVVKPVLDAFFMRAVADAARAAGDPMFAGMLETLDQDCAWHVDVACAWRDLALRIDPENAGVVAGWCDRWRPLVESAVEALAPRFRSASLVDAGGASLVDARVLSAWAEPPAPPAGDVDRERAS